MAEQQLREMLSRLHEELSGGEPVSEETREMLRTVMADIEQRLGSAEGAAEEEEGSLADRVREATLEFEGTHPRLSSALEEMANVLSRMGI